MNTSLGCAIVLSAGLASSAFASELIDSPGRGYREQAGERGGPWLFRQARPDTVIVHVPVSQIGRAFSVFKLPVIHDPDAPFIPEPEPSLNRFDEPIRLQLNRSVLPDPSAAK